MSEFETGTDVLLARYEGRVAVLTFNRPDARNALHPEMYGAFERLLPQLADDPQVGALMLTGAGCAFCAGGDVKGKKLIIMHFRRRKNSRRRVGHRQKYTQVQIEKIQA